MMDIPTKDRLATELRAVATMTKPDRASLYEGLAVRAPTGEFDDYGDAHVCGPSALHAELIRIGADKFARRVAQGEFDASRKESEAWARGQTDPQIVALMAAMGIGPDRTRYQ